MSKKLVPSGEERDYEIEIDDLTWQHAIIVASAYGWRPDGPKYSSLISYAKFRHTIPENDARGIATALEKALPDLPEIRREGINEDDMSPLEYFGGSMRDVVMEIIELCSRGQFMVERL